MKRKLSEEKEFRPVTGKYCKYEYLEFDVFGIPEKKQITMPYISCIGEGPHKIDREQK